MDDLALSFAPEGRKSPISRVFCNKTYLNLSGLETQLKSAKNGLGREEAAYWIMDRIAESFVRITEEAKRQTGARRVLVTGGVACSAFLRRYCEPYGYVFGRKDLCSDNAVGIALAGGSLCR
jgi:tRNA A37 threonylcarbamoyltransferase TsaD